MLRLLIEFRGSVFIVRCSLLLAVCCVLWCSWLFVVCCLYFADCCLLYAVICCLLLARWSLRFACLLCVWRELLVVRFVMCVVCCSLFVV